MSTAPAAPRSSRLAAAAIAIVAILVAACGSSPASSSPASSPPSVAPTASASPATSPTAAPSQTAAPTASPTPTAAPSAAEACPIAPQTGRLPSDRMTDVKLSQTPTADLVTFVFGNMSVPEPPQGTSDGKLQAAVPPYTEAASGMEIQMRGAHVAQVIFTGMSLMNDAGEPTYDGDLRFDVDGWAALREVVNFDMYEGHNSWYIGFDGNGCVTLTSDATSITVAIDHPAS